MKTAALVLMMLVIVVCGAVADDTIPPPVTTESIIASIPTPSDRASWRLCSEEQREMPENAERAQKMKNLSVNCELLHSRITVGKPLSDYPGLLALGYIYWDKSARNYHLRVQSPRYKKQDMYTGFECTIDQSYNIVGVSPLLWLN